MGRSRCISIISFFYIYINWVSRIKMIVIVATSDNKFIYGQIRFCNRLLNSNGSAISYPKIAVLTIFNVDPKFTILIFINIRRCFPIHVDIPYSDKRRSSTYSIIIVSDIYIISASVFKYNMVIITGILIPKVPT